MRPHPVVRVGSKDEWRADGRGTLGDLILHYPRAFVDQRMNAALHDLIIGDLARDNAFLFAVLLDDGGNLGIGNGGAGAGFIPIETGAGLLA